MLLQQQLGQRLLLVTALLLAQRCADAAPLQPHIVTIVLDDWGWANWGHHARLVKNQQLQKEVQTPYMDSLAQNGIVLDRLYVHNVCSPSRSAFLTGRNPRHVNLINRPSDMYDPSLSLDGIWGVPAQMTGIAEKLKSAGYATQHVGKWHLGYASDHQMPSARGYDHFFGYLGGGNDHWTYKINKLSKGSCGRSSLDLWHDAAPAADKVPPHACSYASQDGCTYEDALFERQVTGAIDRHAESNATQPLFLSWAPHAVHAPLQPIAAQEAKFDFIDFPARRKYAAVLNDMDRRVGRVVSTLKRNGMWDDTLLVVMADNGGPSLNEGGANNYPLRGEKGFNTDGGVRANAFIAGGFVPQAQRGSVAEGLIGVEDFYATFCTLAGVTPGDKKAAAAGLPPVDSLDMWPYLSGAVEASPRDLVVVSDGHRPQAVIDRLGYKLIVGETSSRVFQQIEPVAASLKQVRLSAGQTWQQVLRCGSQYPPYTGACLFNVFEDPSESNNIAHAHPEVIKRLAKSLDEAQRDTLQRQYGAEPTAPLKSPACLVSEREWGGFEGPWIEYKNSTNPGNTQDARPSLLGL
ncbi:alkaline-phosphatase-like protein [Tribonema minus]|uniref:Alkaline-phosphatase-like protein n=1 Tax=Tribonema minus TaxID=303371 RepID=A0A835Z0X9_9STRA|nr:alkaline-phosphatase-like protein [Tribonema minus]